MLVGGESKLGSTDDDLDDGGMTKFQLHSHVRSIMSTTTTNGVHIAVLRLLIRGRALRHDANTERCIKRSGRATDYGVFVCVCM